MNLQEFKKNNPEFAAEAAKCKDKFEFTRVSEKYKIKFGTSSFEKAYKMFCEPEMGELSEDDLGEVAGGTSQGDGSGADIRMTDIAGTGVVNIS